MGKGAQNILNTCRISLIRVQWNTINTGTNARAKKKLTVLTGDHINEGSFSIECMAVLPGGQKKAVITR